LLYSHINQLSKQLNIVRDTQNIRDVETQTARVRAEDTCTLG